MRMLGAALAAAARRSSRLRRRRRRAAIRPMPKAPSAALARYVRTLASDPKDFGSLIGAGKAALELGDTQAAAGFFARADEVNPRSPLPQAGMGAVSVANGEAQAALPYFTRAQQLGAPVAIIRLRPRPRLRLARPAGEGAGRLSRRAGRPDGDEARRRLALSLAISGDKAGALQTLAPLMAKGDAAAARARAFVCALTGDSNGAMVAIDAAMPGSWARVPPFLQKLPGLNAGAEGGRGQPRHFPGRRATRPTPIRRRSRITACRRRRRQRRHRSPVGDRRFADQPRPRPSRHRRRSRRAGRARRRRSRLPTVRRSAQSAAPAKSASGSPPGKIWLQLASGPNAAALPSQFDRLKSHNRELMDGIKGYVAKSPDRVAAGDRAVPRHLGRADLRRGPRTRSASTLSAGPIPNPTRLCHSARNEPSHGRRRAAFAVARPASSRTGIRPARPARHLPARPRPHRPFASPSAACATRPRCSSPPTATISASA